MFLIGHWLLYVFEWCIYRFGPQLSTVKNFESSSFSKRFFFLLGIKMGIKMASRPLKMEPPQTKQITQDPPKTVPRSPKNPPKLGWDCVLSHFGFKLGCLVSSWLQDADFADLGNHGTGLAHLPPNWSQDLWPLAWPGGMRSANKFVSFLPTYMTKCSTNWSIHQPRSQGPTFFLVFESSVHDNTLCAASSPRRMDLWIGCFCECRLQVDNRWV